MPPDQLARIFDRFYRSGPGQSCPPGSGLGLAIVNAVAVTHNGTAQASLNDPHGLRITLTLPASGPVSAGPLPRSRTRSPRRADSRPACGFSGVSGPFQASFLVCGRAAEPPNGSGR